MTNYIKHNLEGDFVADSFTKSAHELVDESEKLNNLVRDITESDWMGKDAEAFSEHTNNFNEQMKRAEQAYENLSKSYKHTLQNLEEIHQERMQNLEKLG